MPTLTWVGKDKVVNHHHEVPFRVLNRQYTFQTDPGTPTNSTDNRIIHGDNLEALKSLLPEFEGIKAVRNSLAHDLPSLVINGADFKHVDGFQELVALLRKIEVWWVANFEIPVNPDFDGKEIDEEGIVPGPVLIIQMMLEVLSGNEELLKHYKTGI